MRPIVRVLSDPIMPSRFDGHVTLDLFDSPVGDCCKVASVRVPFECRTRQSCHSELPRLF